MMYVFHGCDALIAIAPRTSTAKTSVPVGVPRQPVVDRPCDRPLNFCSGVLDSVEPTYAL